MEEVLYFIMFLAIWFIIPFVFGRLFFNKLKKRWKRLANDKGVARIFNYCIFLICALVAWLIEMLVLTGVKMML